MATPPLELDFRTQLLDANPFFGAVAPRADVDYLRSLERSVRGAASTPYAGTLLCFDPANAGGSAWHWGQRVNVGTHALRAAMGRSREPGSTGSLSAASTYSASSGATANDEVLTPHTQEVGTESFPPDQEVDVALAALVDEDSPAAPQDRLYEATEDLVPYTEDFEGVGPFHSWIALPILVDDLEGL